LSVVVVVVAGVLEAPSLFPLGAGSDFDAEPSFDFGAAAPGEEFFA